MTYLLGMLVLNYEDIEKGAELKNTQIMKFFTVFIFYQLYTTEVMAAGPH